MNIRQGTVNDADEIATMISSFHHEITEHPDGIGAEDYFDSVSSVAERRYLASDRYLFLVAESEGEMLGFIALRDLSHVLHLFVHRKHQRRGVARQLWESAKSMSQGRSPGGDFTVNSSLHAVPVYSAFGFKQVGEVVSSHGVSVVPMRLLAE